MAGGQHEQVRGVVQRGQVRVRHLAQPGHPLRDADLCGQLAPLRLHRPDAHDEQPRVDLRQGANEIIQPLVIAQPTDKQERRQRDGIPDSRRGYSLAEPRQRDAVGYQVELVLVFGQVRTLAHGRAADDDGVDVAQDTAQQRPVESQDAGLPHDIAVIGQHGGLAPVQQPLAHLPDRIREVQVNHVGPAACELCGQRQAEGCRCDGCDAARTNHAHAAFLRNDRLCSRRIGHEHRHLVSLMRLSFGQQPDVVLDTAQDRRIVLVNVEDLHADACL